VLGVVYDRDAAAGVRALKMLIELMHYPVATGHIFAPARGGMRYGVKAGLPGCRWRTRRICYTGHALQRAMAVSAREDAGGRAGMGIKTK
jgi:hypothetical protein